MRHVAQMDRQVVKITRPAEGPVICDDEFLVAHRYGAFGTWPECPSTPFTKITAGILFNERHACVPRCTALRWDGTIALSESARPGMEKAPSFSLYPGADSAIREMKRLVGAADTWQSYPDRKAVSWPDTTPYQYRRHDPRGGSSRRSCLNRRSKVPSSHHERLGNVGLFLHVCLRKGRLLQSK